MTVLVRSHSETADAVAVVRDALRQADPALPVQQVRPLRDWVIDSTAPARATTMLSTVFTICALLLASVGIYGVIAYFVVSRTREIGIRVAIGATRLGITGLVIGQGMKWAAGGIALGLAGAFVAGRLMATLLDGIGTNDPLTFAVAGGTMALVAAMACGVPALRAIRIDPTTAMRVE